MIYYYFNPLNRVCQHFFGTQTKRVLTNKFNFEFSEFYLQLLANINRTCYNSNMVKGFAKQSA